MSIVNKEIPKVSVCVVTYNQENLIERCLNSILSQEVNFSIEIIVGDDGSTDRTRTIINQFKNRYPKIVKPIFHEKNIGALRNYRLFIALQLVITLLTSMATTGFDQEN